MSEWMKAEQYAYCEQLSAAQWAWEFLRRNPQYRHDWQVFQQTWQRLEARYGKPPNRDFARWKRDPQAYRVVDDASGECRVDHDKVLIECWMGAKWGFYKFPLDPATRQPEMGIALDWREAEIPVPLVEDTQSVYLGAGTEKLAVGFDLALPLREQLERVKRFLQARQGRLRREAKIQMRTVTNLWPRWLLMLRVLDALESGAQAKDICVHLEESMDACAAEYEQIKQEAEQLRAGGYRDLPSLTEK